MTTLTIDQIESAFAENEAEGISLIGDVNFQKIAGELFSNTDPRVIDAVTHAVIEGNSGDCQTSQVRRVIRALEEGFFGAAEKFFLKTFNREYPVDDLDDRAEWENVALVVESETQRGDHRWVFEGP